MSDENVQTNAGPVPYDGMRRAEPAQPVVQGQGGSGFGAAILVAMVFVVVAILAAAIFSNRDVFPLSGVVEAQPVERPTVSRV